MAQITPKTALIVIALLALLAACGGGDPEPEPDQQTPRVDCEKEPQKCR